MVAFFSFKWIERYLCELFKIRIEIKK